MPGWEDAIPTFEVGEKLATRQASGKVLQALLDHVPGLLGGGADLTGNTGTTVKDAGVLSPEDPGGRQMYFGVREHGMAAIMTGMALHGGVLPVGGTFLVFSDYARGAIRLAALSGAKVIYSFTHDSVGVGEDGPTHQPIEHVASLRAIPELSSHPAGRCQRDGGRMEGRRRRRRTDGADPVAPGPPRTRGHLGRRRVPRRIRAAT